MLVDNFIVPEFYYTKSDSLSWVVLIQRLGVGELLKKIIPKNFFS